LDGYEATREIRSDPRFSELPIIAVTAKAMPEDRQKCLDAGLNDFVAKPVDDARLISVMLHWLRPD
ncbi:MAG TPA: response regulator, partial [Sorangium sp.]|nr:response regulator [Sorangium sp.]